MCPQQNQKLSFTFSTKRHRQMANKAKALLSRGVFDHSFPFELLYKLHESSPEIAKCLSPAVKQTIYDLKTGHNLERDQLWGVVDVHGHLPDVTCLKRQGTNPIRLFDSGEASGPPFPNLQTCQTTFRDLTLGFFDPIWRACLPVIVAGGGVIKSLFRGYPQSGIDTDHECWKGDFDLWFTEPVRTDVIAAAQRVLRILQANEHIELYIDNARDGDTNEQVITWDGDRLMVSDSVYNVKISIYDRNNETLHREREMKFDLILKPFASTLAVLTHFDLDCARFAYDGNKFSTTLSGLLAWSMKTSVLDRIDMSRTHLLRTTARILKYGQRGFGIIIFDCPGNVDLDQLYSESYLANSHLAIRSYFGQGRGLQGLLSHQYRWHKQSKNRYLLWYSSPRHMYELIPTTDDMIDKWLAISEDDPTNVNL